MAKGAHDGERHGHAGNHGGRNVAQKNENHHHHQANGKNQRELHVVDGVANGSGIVVNHFQFDGGRYFGAKDRQQTSHAIHHFHRVGAGLALNRQDDGSTVVHPGPNLVVFHVVQHAAKFFQPHRIAVAVGDDHAAVLGGVRQLAGRLDGKGLLVPIQFPGRKIAVVGYDGGLHFIDADAARRQRVRIQLNAHCIFLPSENIHLRYAGNGGDALRHHRLGVLIHRVNRQRIRAQTQENNPLVGRIHFVESRWPRHGRRKQTTGLGDGGLDVLRGGVDVPVQTELHGDVGAAERARRIHRVDSRDGRKLALQGRGYRGGHGVGTRSRQRRLHLNGRIVHAGQSRHRQRAIADDAEQQNAERGQRGENRPLNEKMRKIHQAPASALAAGAMRMCAPGNNRSWPSVTTVSPGEIPLSTTI